MSIYFASAITTEIHMPTFANKKLESPSFMWQRSIDIRLYHRCYLQIGFVIIKTYINKTGFYYALSIMDRSHY
ncbi:hypothetical protein EGC86_12790 [Shewanella frigidimarina]|nr:hypothetical protein EGC86_12790 [Shewanella frigidimarina]